MRVHQHCQVIIVNWDAFYMVPGWLGFKKTGKLF